jgi:hypothetical protein
MKLSDVTFFTIECTKHVQLKVHQLETDERQSRAAPPLHGEMPFVKEAGDLENPALKGKLAAHHFRPGSA